MTTNNMRSTEVNIVIMGVGGGGSNAVSRMVKGRAESTQLCCLNTDVQALENMDVTRKIPIGQRLTKGLGAGGNPDLGRQSAEESKAEILKAIQGADIVFVAAGMGGGTGTGAAPVVARLAKAAGALTIAVVTKPFSFEGQKRRRLADAGIKALTKRVDTIVTISNDRLLEMSDSNVSMMGALAMADDVLAQGIRAISDVITVAGEINVDFADVRSIMTDSGRALMAIGTGKGVNRVKEATHAVLSSPLLDTPIKGATGVLFDITGGDDLTLVEVNRVAQLIGEAVNPEAEKIFGVLTDKKLDGFLRITLIATGLGADGAGRSSNEDYRKGSTAERNGRYSLAGEPALSSNREGFNLDIPTFLRRKGGDKVREQSLP